MSNANLGSIPTWIDHGLDVCLKWIRAPLQPVVDCIAPWQKNNAPQQSGCVQSRQMVAVSPMGWTGCRLQMAANDSRLSPDVAMPRIPSAAGPTPGASPQRHIPKCPVSPRLRLSGKLCDVCAELDRLCAARAQAQDQQAA